MPRRKSIVISAVLPTAMQPRSRILNRNGNGGEWTHKALQLRFQIIGSFVIQVALALPLLSTSVLAFEQTATGAFMESYAEAAQLFLRNLQDSNALGVDSQFESNSKFGAKPNAFDMTKESKKVNLGLLSVTTSVTNSKTLFGAGPPTEMRHDQTIALDLTGLRNQAGAVSPSSVYLNSFVKQTPYQTISEGEGTDRTTGTGAGAYWGWNGGSANLNYWNYSLDSRPVGQPYSSTGRGFDASIGTYWNEIGFYAGFSYSDTKELWSLGNAVELGNNAYLSMSYKPQHLPDMVISLSIGRYEYNDLMYGIGDAASYRTASLEFDFSKFLLSQFQTSIKVTTKSPSAKLFYKYYTQTDHSSVVVTPASNQFLGVMFGGPLY
jgi:hypothetical protein